MQIDYHGIQLCDLSTYQDAPQIPGHVDFHKMKAYGIAGVIFRAGHGLYKDLDFDRYWQDSKGILPRGTYWYYENQHPPKAQARAYWEIIGADHQGVCIIDLEDRSAGNYAHYDDWYDCLEETKRLSRLKSDQIWIYTGPYYWQEYTLHASLAELNYFRQYSLWMADYGPRGSDPLKPNYLIKHVPDPWADQECIAVQTGTPSIGWQVGVESREVDYSQLNGDAKRFYNSFVKYDGAYIPSNGGSHERALRLSIKFI